MKIRLLFVIGSAAALFAACEKEAVVMSDAGTSYKSSTDTTGNGITATVSFSKDLLPIFTANCVSCHGAGTRFSVTTQDAYKTIVNGGYVNKQDPEKSKFFVNSLQGHPDDYLTPAEHQKIATWMKEGAKNN